jgi:hypothetical protein
MKIPRIAVVPTHNRPRELARLLDALAPQCHVVVVIDNASTPPVNLSRWHWTGDPDGPDLRGMVQHLIRDEEQPPNLSRLWNVGLNFAQWWAWADVEPEPFDVAVLNDDAVPPPGWWDAVSGAMREHRASAASADPFDQMMAGELRVWFADAPMSVGTRLAGWAFMLPGEDGMRADERFRWLAGDDDLSYRARLARGLVHVGGVPVLNTGENTSTVGVLAEQGARDMQMFVDIHGRRPW